MNHEAQSVGNRFNESKSEEQTRLADEALRRTQGDSPAVGASASRQSDVISNRNHTPMPANDTLSWGGGEHLVTVEAGLQPFPAVAAGVDGDHIAPQPPERFGPLTSAPLAIESNSGRAMSSKDLFKD